MNTCDIVNRKQRGECMYSFEKCIYRNFCNLIKTQGDDWKGNCGLSHTEEEDQLLLG